MNIGKDLTQFRQTITSQWGEDGIIAEIFRQIGTQNKTCVEFGAWDGKYLSNTWDLWHNKGWSSVLIEGDNKRIADLKKNLQDFEQVVAVNKFVTPEGDNSLDNILTRLSLPQNFDLLSMDVDGDDYYIFESLEEFHPRVVIIEYNPTIPPELDIVQAQGEHFGASAWALVKLAVKKDYSLVYCTETNCFFVINTELHKLGEQATNLQEVFPTNHLTYIISSQDGCTFLSRQPTYVPFFRKARLSTWIRALLGKRLTHPKLISRERMIPVKIQPK